MLSIENNSATQM